MRRIAAFDTSTWRGGVALVEGSDGDGGPSVVAEAGLLAQDSLASHVLSLLERLLAEAGWARTSVDGWAVTRGPGSFTGLRVGLGTVRGLGISSGRPCIGVGTLEAMAEALGPAEGERLPLLDAGRGEVYGARYDADSSPPRELEAPWVGLPERAVEGGHGVSVLFGPGAEAYFEYLRAAGHDVRLRRSPSGVAAGAGRIAWRPLRSGVARDEGMAPFYLRPSDAELKG